MASDSGQYTGQRRSKALRHSWGLRGHVRWRASLGPSLSESCPWHQAFWGGHGGKPSPGRPRTGTGSAAEQSAQPQTQG